MGQTLLRGPQGTAGPSCPASGGLPGPLLGHRLVSQDPLPEAGCAFPGSPQDGEVWGCQCLWPGTAYVSVTVPPCRWPCKWTQVSAGLTKGLPRPAPGHPQVPRLTHTRSRASGPETHIQGLLRPLGPRWLLPAGGQGRAIPFCGEQNRSSQGPVDWAGRPPWGPQVLSKPFPKYPAALARTPRQARGLRHVRPKPHS